MALRMLVVPSMGMRRALLPCRSSNVTSFGRLFSSGKETKAPLGGLTEEQKYLFDTNGYLVVKGVLSPEEVKAANAAIDIHRGEFLGRHGATLRNTQDDSPLQGDLVTPREDLGGHLGWPIEDSRVFRSILDHPNLAPYYHDLVGEGYRLDHSPLLVIQSKGSEGFTLHGGARTSDGHYNHTLAYSCVDGRIRNALLGAAVQLTDVNEGDGGFAIIKGSHKSSFACPQDITLLRSGKEHVYQPVTKAGDVVLFSEATCHGTFPWTATNERRMALFRFSPSTCAYGRAYLNWPQHYVEGMTETQLAVMQPAYNVRLDRPMVTRKGSDGGVKVGRRDAVKRDFDEQVFKTKHF